jgi:hypothetical protein
LTFLTDLKYKELAQLNSPYNKSIFDYVTKEGIYALIKKVTDEIFKSSRVMTEILEFVDDNDGEQENVGNDG